MGRQDSASALMKLFPGEELAMETALIEVGLSEKLHIQSRSSIRDGREVLVINLNDGYKLLLEPAAAGYSGNAMWFGKVTDRGANPDVRTIRSEIQAKVTLIRVNLDGESTLSSFASHSNNVEQLLVESLAKIEKFCSLRLVPLPIVTVNEETTTNNQTNPAAHLKGDDTH